MVRFSDIEPGACALPDENTRRDVAAQLREFGRVLREQWWLVILCIVLAGFAAAAYSSSQQKIYESTAKLLIQPGDIGAAITGTGIGPNDPVRQVATDTQLVSLPAVAARVQKKMKQPLAPATVSTSQSGDSNVISIDVRDPRPNRAARIANLFANEYLAFRSEANRRNLQFALRTLQSRLSGLPKKGSSADRARLRRQIKDFQLLQSLQNGDAQVIQQALPSGAPVSPKPTRNLILGLILGAVVGVGLALLRDRFDRRIKNQAQIEAILPSVPIIAWVPRPRRGRAAQQRAADAYYALRTNLGYLSRNGPFRSVLITSAMAGEGKSSTALNLGLSMGELDDHVVVIDADLRRPALSMRLKAGGREGVSRVLAGETAIGDAVERRPVEASANGAGPVPALSGEIAIVPSGPLPQSPQVLLTEHALRSLLASAGEANRTVIVDGPPIGAVSDMLPVARAVDAVVVVVRLYHSRKDALARLAAQLENANVTPTGIVMIGIPNAASAYYDYGAGR
jgi:succinoglycan biosynthesis transport protein ExoP